MAKFFITSNIVHSGRQFQFHFETDEADSIVELCDILEKGGFVTGERFDYRAPQNRSLRTPMAISSAMVGMIQPSEWRRMPPPRSYSTAELAGAAKGGEEGPIEAA